MPLFEMYGVRLGPCHSRTTRTSPGQAIRICFSHVHQLLVFLAACAGGAINSVAGGGTLLTVPTLIWLGAPALDANATSTVALWPGSLSGAWGFRREMRQADPRVYALVVPSLIGGLTGAILLKRTPPGVFEA